uniref:Si:dkey-93h22.8 n=1 Tax=Cyclopterus lumpus TaxID=8103 RepID=A0A8C2ZPJ0_CYCLU
MLDSVEDDDETLSPFDTLPDTKLLTHPERRDTSELLLADRLRPRSKSPNLTFTMKIDGENEDKSNMGRNSPQQLFKQQSQTLFHSTNKKVDAEVEVFTSTYLVNLVKLMHPYCLKLHVEEEADELRENHTLFSQEEVWKYERPSEESNEEINVVSDDDEVTVKDPKEEAEKSYNILLKSVLLNGNLSRTPPPREKKRVSFGTVQVASFELTEKGSSRLIERNLTTEQTSETASVSLNSTNALENPAGSALEPQTLSSEMSSDKAATLSLKGETKVKSLSLQQYRQLRQKRLPLVEKQRNYTTMWPCVSEPPTELTPILCLQEQRQNSCGPKDTHQYPDGRRSGADQLHLSETPAKEENKPESKLAPSQSNLRTTSVLTQRASVETLEPLSTSESPGNPETLGRSPPLQMLEGADIPQPLGTDIILSTRQDLPAKRRNPPSKAIQIIEPRPLPSKKTHTSLPAAHSSPHMYSSVSSDHDYCGSMDRSVTSATQRSKASKPKDVSQTPDEYQVTTHDSSAAAECKNPTSTSELSTTIGAVMYSEQPRTRSATTEDETASCILPTPPPSPLARGREKRRYRRRSPRSDSSSSSSSLSSSSSSSASPSPKRQK